MRKGVDDRSDPIRESWGCERVSGSADEKLLEVCKEILLTIKELKEFLTQDSLSSVSKSMRVKSNILKNYVSRVRDLGEIPWNIVLVNLYKELEKSLGIELDDYYEQAKLKYGADIFRLDAIAADNSLYAEALKILKRFIYALLAAEGDEDEQDLGDAAKAEKAK